MECPFCAETIRDEAIARKHCSRDLRVARPIMLEFEEVVSELAGLGRELDYVNAKLDRVTHPFRNGLTYETAYVLIPAAMLVAAHVLVTIILNVTPLYLRLASVIIPLPFGLAIYAREKVRIRGALFIGVVTATLSILCMLTVTGLNDDVPIIPGPWIEWREAIEYAASIALAFVTGNILGSLIFQVFPKIMAGGGRPNSVSFHITPGPGPYFGGGQLRPPAPIIQEFLH